MQNFLVLLLVLTTASAASAVEFRFAPADGLECDQKLSKKTLREITGAPKKREDSAESVTRLKWKKTDDGYRVESVLKSAEMKRDGNAVQDPMTAKMIGREIVYRIDANGVASDIEGYDSVIDEVMAALPPETRKQLAGVLNVENLKARELQEWNGRYASFIGKKAEQGDVWEGEEEAALPTGPLKISSRTNFEKIETKGGRPIVTVDFAYAMDKDSAKKIMDKSLAVVSAMAKDAPPATLGKPEIRGSGERVFDASTMNIERETVTRVITMPMEIPEKGKVTMIGTDTIDYVYDCKK